MKSLNKITVKIDIMSDETRDIIDNLEEDYFVTLDSGMNVSEGLHDADILQKFMERRAPKCKLIGRIKNITKGIYEAKFSYEDEVAVFRLVTSKIERIY